METIKRRYIDWKKTGIRLKNLRNHNLTLRRYVCHALNYDKGDCQGKCESCEYELDSSISRAELASVFNISESVVFNWENGKTPISVEDLLYYCEICGVELSDVLVFS